MTMNHIRRTLGIAVVVVGSLMLPFALHAQDCIDKTKLNVSSKCQAAGYDHAPYKNAFIDVNDAGTTFFSDNGMLLSCSSACTIERGDSLCGAFAAFAKLTEAYVCVPKADCQGPLSAKVSAASQACPGVGTATEHQCCLKPAGAAKPGATPAARPRPTELPDPLGGANIPSIIGGVIRAFAGIAGSIALVMFVWGGISMILSQGESSKVENAKKTLVNAGIGIVLIFAAYTFVSAIIDAIIAQPT